MRIQASVLINCPAEAVFACLTSMPFLQQWIAPFRTDVYDFPPEKGYREVYHTLRIPELRQVTEGAMGVGTIFKQSNEIKAHPVEATIEITEYDPPRVFTLNITGEIGISQKKWVLQSTFDGTRLILQEEQEFRGWWVKLVAVIAPLVAAQAVPGSLQYMNRLKQYIEDQCKHSP